MPGPSPVLNMENISRHYGGRVEVLSDLSFRVEEGEAVAVIAPSGSGKSTLLHLAGLLEAPDKGEVSIIGKPASQMSDNKKTALRAHKIGIIYQFHGLLPEFSALENILIPQYLAGRKKTEALKRAEELFQAIGLVDRMKHRPGELSGGEQQRVALARAMANHPALLLADEPTGNLDPQRGEAMVDLLHSLVRQEKTALVMATHNHKLASRMERIVTLKAGRMAETSLKEL